MHTLRQTPRPTRKQLRLVDIVLDGFEAELKFLDTVEDRRALMSAPDAKRGRAVLANARRLLAGSGVVPGYTLADETRVHPGELLAALLAAEEATIRFFGRFPRPVPERYPRHRRRW